MASWFIRWPCLSTGARPRLRPVAAPTISAGSLASRTFPFMRERRSFARSFRAAWSEARNSGAGFRTRCCPADANEWSGLSYDHTLALGASTWRHVLFLEQDRNRGPQVAGPMTGATEDPFRWVFLSDVCKHCEQAGCLESCPTGAIVRTENQAVFVQDDVCNGCGYCVVSCPFGVIDRREAH